MNTDYPISDQCSIFGNLFITLRMAQVSRRGRLPLVLLYAAGPTSSCTFLLRCLGSCSRHPRCTLLFNPSWELRLTHEQRPSFFAVRLTLGLICSLCEATFYRSVVEHVSDRVGRYMFFMLFFSAGMWNASAGTSSSCLLRSIVTNELLSAFLPSTFAMYFNMLAMSFALRPSTKRADDRVLFATVCFSAGAIVGWPFSIVVSFPFVFEELFILSGDKISPALMGKWIGARWIRMLGCVTFAAFLLVRPSTKLPLALCSPNFRSLCL